MTKRKTVTIEFLKSEVNRKNRESTCDAKVRDGWNDLLESMLHATGNYNGYRNLLPTEVPKGHKPGMLEDRGAFPKALDVDNSDAFEGCDDSRKFYY